MILSTPVQNDVLQLVATSTTVAEPGERFFYRLNVTALQPCTLRSLQWSIPATLPAQPVAESDFKPLSLAAGESREISMEMQAEPDKEGFGEMQLILEVVSSQADTPSLSWKTWLSVFDRAVAPAREALNDALRERLIAVVNHRDRNGHIFLADYVAFFQDFLNIEVPEDIAELISTEMGLPIEGLPLDPETYLEIILGNKTFYGIERLELIAEEYCNESDDRFDPDDAREVEFLNLQP